jgi:hypothetical protein
MIEDNENDKGTSLLDHDKVIEQRKVIANNSILSQD